jgi:hypothetical protein
MKAKTEPDLAPAFSLMPSFPRRMEVDSHDDLAADSLPIRYCARNIAVILSAGTEVDEYRVQVKASKRGALAALASE